jgi:DNA-binding LacI/PurR family transcriptional regulator
MYRERLERLVEQGTHFVLWGAVQNGQPGPSVGSDNFQGSYDATRHLLNLGRRNIAFLGTASNQYPEFLERYRGYTRALQDAGILAHRGLQVDAITTERCGYLAAGELLNRGQPFDGIIAASDLIGLGALHALQEQHIDVPGQVSIVGFDDIPAATLINPPITTVAQDTKLAGEVLVDTVLRRVRNEPAESRVLPTRLVVRHSCGARGP